MINLQTDENKILPPKKNETLLAECGVRNSAGDYFLLIIRIWDLYAVDFF